MTTLPTQRGGITAGRHYSRLPTRPPAGSCVALQLLPKHASCPALYSSLCMAVQCALCCVVINSYMIACYGITEEESQHQTLLMYVTLVLVAVFRSLMYVCRNGLKRDIVGSKSLASLLPFSKSLISARSSAPCARKSLICVVMVNMERARSCIVVAAKIIGTDVATQLSAETGRALSLSTTPNASRNPDARLQRKAIVRRTLIVYFSWL